MIRRLASLVLTAAVVFASASGAVAQERRKIGVAFGGGSAKGIAHVGVIRWFEEHRIPIDVASGTSMGGLIGGCYATGMSAAELDHLLSTMKLGRAVRGVELRLPRTSGARRTRAAYPSRLEFGLRKGFSPPHLPELRRAGGPG